MNKITNDIKNKLNKSGNKFLSEQDGVTFSRYNSWEYCYESFMTIANKEIIEEIDYQYLALNLAFYLASWGMYRGSSFILQTDYKIHIEPIKKIMSFIIKNKKQIDNDEIIEWKEIDDIKKYLKNYYMSIDYYDKGKIRKPKNVTNTFITKILMGTTGIVPAFDTNVKYCLKIFGIGQSLNKKSYNDLHSFYEENKDLFIEIKNNAELLKKITKPYPKMKILDMCLWQYYKDYGKKKK